MNSRTRSPEDVFIEFWFGPEDIKRYEGFWNEFYGSTIGEPREQRLQAGGTRTRSVRGQNYVDYWKSKADSDHEGMVAHGLGHALANILYNNDGRMNQQDWMTEGLGYYISFEFLGRNSVTCKAFHRHEYGKPDKEEGLKTMALGQRASFNALALSKGRSLDQLATKKLYEMDDADLAKSWSMMDFVVSKLGEEGLLFLKSACYNSATQSGFLTEWRSEAQEIFALGDRDALGVIEDRWKAYAKQGQKKAPKKRRRR